MKITPVTNCDKVRLRTKPMMAIHFNAHTVVYPDGKRSAHTEAREAWSEYERAVDVSV